MSTFFDTDATIAITPKGAVAPHVTKTVNTRKTENTYALMMYISRSLGVGCNHCHNSRQFADWSQSQPQRTKAWFGIRQVRELNKSYILPLKDILPASRKGPLGDPMRIGCETCHQGINKPLFGEPMLKDYPALAAPTQAAAPAPAAVPAAPAAADNGSDGVAAPAAKVTGEVRTAVGVM